MVSFLENGWLTLLLLTMSSYARSMIKLGADDELKDTIVMATLKLFDARPKKIISDVVKNLNNLRQATRGNFFLNDDGKPLPNSVSTINSKVQEVFDEHANFMASKGLKRGSNSGYGTNSLWKQWKGTKSDDDYDPYDDDLYDSHDMSDNL
nr:hypothetical protein [Tanacetum cinerariifolium]